MSTLTEILKSNLNNSASSQEFDLHAALDEVLSDVGLTASDCGGKITFYGKDPIVPSRLRFGTMSAIGLAAKAVAAAGIWRFRSGEGQDIHVDVRVAAVCTLLRARMGEGEWSSSFICLRSGKSFHSLPQHDFMA
jgi:hypothetical protein